MSRYALDTTGLTDNQVDTRRKSSIVEVVTNAGAPVDLATIRYELSVSQETAYRLVNEMVDSGTLVRESIGGKFAVPA